MLEFYYFVPLAFADSALLAPLMCRHDIKFIKQSCCALLLCVHTSRVAVLHRCVLRVPELQELYVRSE
jgi:hypothetical protein